MQADERETNILYDDTNHPAKVYTYNAALQRKLAKLAEQRPSEVILLKEPDEYNCAVYSVPKKWIKISPPRRVSDEQKAVAKERMSAYQKQKHSIQNQA